MGQKRQGGSTIGYIIIGVVLITGLVGGVYALRQSSAQKPAEVAVKPTEDKKAEQSKSEEQTRSEEQQKEETQATEQANQQVQSEKKDETSAEEPKPTSPQPQSQELPRTGAADVTSGLLAFGLLGGTGVAYLRSRRFTLT